VNVGQNTTLCDGDVSQQLVQLLIVSDGELKMTGDDTGLLVVTSGVASQLEDFGSEVLEDSGQVDGSTGTDTLSVVALSQKTVDTTNGESKTRLGRTAAIESDLIYPSIVMETNAWNASIEFTYDWEFLEPEALPPDLPPPVILK
jgi:hypothetical protein